MRGRCQAPLPLCLIIPNPLWRQAPILASWIEWGKFGRQRSNHSAITMVVSLNSPSSLDLTSNYDWRQKECVILTQLAIGGLMLDLSNITAG